MFPSIYAPVPPHNMQVIEWFFSQWQTGVFYAFKGSKCSQYFILLFRTPNSALHTVHTFIIFGDLSAAKKIKTPFCKILLLSFPPYPNIYDTISVLCILHLKHMSLQKLPQLNFTFKAMKRPLSFPCSIALPLHIIKQIIKSFLMLPWTRFRGHFEENITMKSRELTNAVASRNKNQPIFLKQFYYLGL